MTEPIADLYVRDNGQVRGPLAARIIQKMLTENQLPMRLEFSPDQQHWMPVAALNTYFSADTAVSTPVSASPKHAPAVAVPTLSTSLRAAIPDTASDSEELSRLLPKIIKSGADTTEIKKILGRTRRAAKRLSWAFVPAIGGIFAITCTGFSMLAALVIGHFFLQLSPWLQVVLVLLPAALLAAAASHVLGNLVIRILSGLDHHARHCLALHLPWNRAPKEWPRFFRRWIYCGDWLIENFSSDLTPYIRAFVTGAELHGIGDELAIWDELMQATSRGSHVPNWETGHSVRELAKVDALPAWVRDITPGMNLWDMEKSLGNAGHAWAVNLLKRAAMRKKSFGKIDFDGDLHEAMFEFHYCSLRGEREGLLVVIRPHQADMAYLADSVSDNLAA